MGSNRQKKREPKPGRGWCFGCDAALVSDGQKCPVCGKLKGAKRNKKPS